MVQTCRSCEGSSPNPLLIDSDHFEEQRSLFKAFSDPRRLQILSLLRHGELCACDLLANLEISQPTLSHHMKILTTAGVVAARSAGRWTYYSTNTAGLSRARDLIVQMSAPAGGPAGPEGCTLSCGCKS